MSHGKVFLTAKRLAKLVPIVRPMLSLNKLIYKPGDYVAYTDGHRITYGDRLMSMPPGQQNFVLLHECFHILARHPWQAKFLNKNKDLANLAMDLVINQTIAMCNPFLSRQTDILTPPDAITMDKMPKRVQSQLQALTQVKNSNSLGYHWQEVYELLIENTDLQPTGHTNEQNCNTNEQNCNTNGEPSNENWQPNHQDAIIAAKIERLAQKAMDWGDVKPASVAGTQHGDGQAPITANDLAMQILQPPKKLDEAARAVAKLQRFVCSGKMQSWRRPSRRRHHLPGLFPGKTRGRRGINPLILMDISASMQSSLVNSLDEIADYLRQSQILAGSPPVIYFNTRPIATCMLHECNKHRLATGGGTSLDWLPKFLTSNAEKLGIDSIILISDLEVLAPKISPKLRLPMIALVVTEYDRQVKARFRRNRFKKAIKMNGWQNETNCIEMVHFAEII